MLRRIPEVHAVEDEWGLGLERLVAEHTARGDSVLVFFKNETQMKKYPGEGWAQTMSAVMPLKNKTLIKSLNMAALGLQPCSTCRLGQHAVLDRAHKSKEP